MKPKVWNFKELEAIAAKYGATPMPKDHPVYSEGPSIMFISPRQKPSKQNGDLMDQAKSGSGKGPDE